ncbi:YncE family protein [Bradyrhizobium erythrophlei]|uniref:YncE family protein n=1 Tax=Bradyrhizobium erythrophlei TaxID=1437360 RepID=UPI0035E785EE
MRLATLAFAASLLTATSAPAFDGWRLQDTQILPSNGSSWDYLHLDPTQPRLFIGNRKEGLKVYDLRSKKIVKVIDQTEQHSSNGVTLAPDLDLGISNNEDGTITPFRLSSLQAAEAIKLANELDNSHYDPSTKRLIVNVAPDKDGTGLVVLDAPSLKVVGTIKVPTLKPEHADFDGNGVMFLAGRDTDTVYRIDTRQMTVTASWSTPGCARTNSLVYDAGNRRILLGCRGSDTVKPSFAVMNADSGQIVYTAEIGGGVDGIVFDPRTKRVFLSCGVSAVINIFEQLSADSYRPIEAVGTQAGARTLAYDPVMERLYSVTAEGTADLSKKVVTSVSPFYANVFFRNTFKVLTYAK